MRRPPFRQHWKKTYSISAAKSGLAVRFLRRALAGDGIGFLFRVLNLLASRLQIFSGVP
jgi:hypothetical protein